MLIESMELRSGETKEFTLPSNEIRLITSGRIHSILSGNTHGELRKGNIIFLSEGDRVSFKAYTKSSILIFRLSDNIHLCQNFSIEQLYTEMKGQEKPETPFPLEINARLWHFAIGVVNGLKDGLRCRIAHRAEISKLLIMLYVYYSKEDLYGFFYSILSPDTLFSDYVQKNHLKYRTISELANSMNMTSLQFTRRFKSAFGVTPHKWMQEEKAQIIYKEITNSTKPLKEIAIEFGFTDQSNFNRFCNTFYKLTPKQIRKQNQNK